MAHAMPRQVVQQMARHCDCARKCRERFSQALAVSRIVQTAGGITATEHCEYRAPRFHELGANFLRNIAEFAENEVNPVPIEELAVAVNRPEQDILKPGRQFQVQVAGKLADARTFVGESLLSEHGFVKTLCGDKDRPACKKMLDMSQDKGLGADIDRTGNNGQFFWISGHSAFCGSQYTGFVGRVASADQ
ncbi:MAG: hypothetical protein R3D35_14005 [Nitratireductor sp.]